MNWYWRPGVHVALHGQDLVILDTTANNYHVLPAGAGRLELSADRSAAMADPDLIAMFAAASLGAGAPFPARRPAPLPPAPRRDLEGEPCRPPTDADRRRMGRALLRLVSGYYGRPLSRLIAPGSLRPAGPTAIDEPELRRLVLAWRALLPWIPFQGACLYRAAALRAFLGPQGGAVSWVFGVSTWPFAAHCWLQRGDLVLGDHLAQVRRYTPILAA